MKGITVIEGGRKGKDQLNSCDTFKIVPFVPLLDDGYTTKYSGMGSKKEHLEHFNTLRKLLPKINLNRNGNSEIRDTIGRGNLFAFAIFFEVFL